MMMMVLLAACQGGQEGSASPAASRPTSPAHAAVRTLATGCTHTSPCLNIAAGAYRLGPGTLMPGLELAMPAGWSSTGTGPTELNLVPPAGQPEDALKFWLDMLAVKSTGPGHGTILTSVGTTPSALLAWFTGNPDFLLVSKPAPATIGQDIKMTSLAVVVSRSAKSDDLNCPAMPRCADMFTNRHWNGGAYSIGGDEEVRLYLGTIQIGGSPHTFLIDLDAADHADLLRLETPRNPSAASACRPAPPAADQATPEALGSPGRFKRIRPTQLNAAASQRTCRPHPQQLPRTGLASPRRGRARPSRRRPRRHPCRSCRPGPAAPGCNTLKLPCR
jgi:hypothetical protein